MIKRKTKAKLNRTLSGILAVIMTASMTSVLPASAEDEVSPYPYTLFAGSSDDGAISSTAGNFCVNGNVATNGTFSVGSNFNVNGTKTEHADVDMPIIFDQIDDKFFSGEVDMHSEDYSYSETNINVTVPIEVQGVLSLDGNITLTTGLKALDDVTLTGEVKNTDGSVICSQTGDVIIDSTNVNLGGLVYAPYGTVSLKAQNLNLNNVVIIADKISIDAPNVNANSSSSMAQFVGEAIAASNNNSDNNGGESGSQTDEEPLIYAFGSYNEDENAIDIEWYSNIDGSYEILESADNDVYTIVAEVSEFTTYRYPIEDDFDTKYFKVKVTSSDNTAESVPFIVTRSDDGYSVDFLDSDGDGLADIYEDIIGTNANNADTDDDGLSDYDEVYITGTDPTKYDSVTDAVSDYDADNDSDGLGNGREIELGTDPLNPDTDDDDLNDGEEVNSYGTDPLVPDTDNDGLDDVAEIEFETDPLNPDSDSNGVLDGDEKRQQTFTFEVENKDCAVSEVTVSSECTGYLKNSMTVHSIMNEDQLCSNIVGLVGEPFEIETTSDFDTATITFSINKSKLKGKSLDDLQFLWYDEENDEFIELPTSFDENNSSISVETTHFSKYAAVDSDKWENNWNEILTDLKMLETADIKDTQTSVNIVFDRSFTDSCADPVTYVDNFAYCNRLTLIKDLLSSFDYRCSKVTEIGNGTYTIIDPYGRDYDLDVDEYSEVLFHTNATKHYGYLYPVKCFEFDPTYTNLNMTSVLYVVDTVENQMKYKFPDSEPINIYIIANNYTEYYYDQIEYDYSRELSKINSKLYVIDMCPEDHSLLQSIAESTGGEYLKYTPANVEHLKSILSSGSYGSALKDSDKDGFSDMEEERIGLVSSNGVRHYTNAHSKYSDEDSFTDNEEASKYFTTESSFSTVKKKYHTMTSYPDMEDSDGDGFVDPNDPNPLKTDIKKIELRREQYINILLEKVKDEKQYSYGSDQNWFMDFKSVDEKKYTMAAEHGCGVIALADLITYLSIYDKYTDLQESGLYDPYTDDFNYDDYLMYLKELLERFPVFGKMGNINFQFPHSSYSSFVSEILIPFPLSTIPSLYFKKDSVYGELNLSLSDYYSLRWNTIKNSDRTYNDIKKMLSKNIPVVMSYDNYFDEHKTKLTLYSEYINDGDYTTQIAKSHYFTVTGVIEISDDISISELTVPSKTILQVSSWGEKYYISFEDYIKQQNAFSNYLYINRF